MAKLLKLWQKISKRPYASGVTMREAHSLLIQVGFIKVSQKSSHRIYKHNDFEDSTQVIPCKNDTDVIKPAYVKNIYEAIIRYELEDLV